MAVPTRVGWAQDSTGAQTVTIDTGDIAVGSWMILMRVWTDTTITGDAPEGWTRIFGTTAMGTRCTDVWAKIRTADEAGKTSYDFSLSAGTNHRAVVMWGAGSGPVTDWLIGDDRRRGDITPTTTFDNEAASITTPVPSLVLTLSAEATGAAESAISSITGATEWFFAAQGTGGEPAVIATVDVGYIEQTAAGATPDVTIVYPNTQPNNGWAVQIGIPPAAQHLQLAKWDGTNEVPITLTRWDGSDEANLASIDTAVGDGPDWPTLLTSPAPLTIAHRGGDYCWPQLTMRAFKESAQIWRMSAIEVSVQYSSDGTPWCLHNSTTDDATGTSGTVANMTDAQLEALTVLSSSTDNPTQPNEPLAKLTDVLALYGGKRVIFIEDKTYAHTNDVLDLMDTWGGVGWYVWKQSGDGVPFLGQDGRGYPTWGYYFNGTDVYDSTYANWDYVGLDYNFSDADLTTMIAAAGAENVIGHIIADQTQYDRMLGFGIRGLMVSNVRDLIAR